MVRSIKSNRFALWVLSLGAFLDWMSYGIVYPFFAMLIFRHDSAFFGMTQEAFRGVWLGVLVAISPIGQFFAAPILGRLSDHIGRKRILQIAFIIIGLGYFLSALGIWQKSLYSLILGRLVTGIGAGNISVINSSVADLSMPDEKAKYFALIAMASGMGFTAGPFLGGKLSMWGFKLPFIIAGVLSLITSAFFMALFSETHLKKEMHVKAAQLFKDIRLPSFGKFYIFFSAFFVFCFGWSFYWEFISVTWIKIYDRNASQIGNFYAYGSLFYVLSSGILIRPILKRFNAKRLLLGSWLALGICFFLLLHQKITLFWVYIPIQQFLVALVFPLGAAFISNAVTNEEQGEALGNFQSLQSFAFAITPLLGGILLDLTYYMPIIIGGAAMILAFIILLICFRNTDFNRRKV